MLPVAACATGSIITQLSLLLQRYRPSENLQNQVFDLYVMKVLIVEDELELSKSIVSYLSTENYLCETAYDFNSAVDKTALYDYDCILLDIGLPDGNGLRVLEFLKRNRKADGVIIISARNSINDRIEGLNLGADDYLSKPFHMSELSARIAALIRRRQFNGSRVVEINELNIDVTGKTVQVNDQKIDLTRREYDLLLYLISNRNRVISRNALAEHLSGENVEIYDKFDFLYSHIKNLKKKLTAAGCTDYIKTIYGMGYKFEA